MKIRQAVAADAAEVSSFLVDLVALGKRRNRSDEAFVIAHYIENPDAIRCSVAEDDEFSVLGLQVLRWARDGDPLGVTPGWGVIGTHVAPKAARRGVGRALFAATYQAAKDAGLKMIDATIGADNVEGLAYYEAMGFHTYRNGDGTICKCFDMDRERRRSSSRTDRS